jgi:glycosyltransferase involved in cell wall biosynthesis
MRIAYLCNQYPSVSHSFIRREILALEKCNMDVLRIALREWDGELLDPENRLERKRTRYVLGDGVPALVVALSKMLLTRPVRLLQALTLALRMGRRAERPMPVHLIYLAEACRVVLWLRGAGIQHLHAHFGTNSAEVAMLVHALGGPKWSFTVHGPEEFDNVQLIGIAEKIRRSAFVVAISSYGQSQLYRLVEHHYWPKIKVVHCGLEPAYFTETTNLTSTRRFVCVGRLCAQKGQLVLIEAAHRLTERGIGFELVLAGDGPLRAEIEASIQRHKLQDRVRITGWISAAEVREQILAARVLVLPSFAEGLPIVIMEAMALQRPVISTFVGGIPELVQPGEHGWLVPAGDVEALEHAIKACLDAPTEMLTRMGKAANKRVIERHDVDKQAIQLAKLFEMAIEGGTRPS